MQNMDQDKQNLNVRKSNARAWSFAKAILFIVPAILFWVALSVVVFGLVWVVALGDDDTCNIGRVPIQGIITTTDNGLSQVFGLSAITSADDIVAMLKFAEEDESIDAIIIDIDSPGGTPVAADEIMTVLAEIEKPVVAVVRDRGASAAYWVAAGADHIIASPVSDVGSVGVTMSYLEFASTTDNQGARWIDISSGEYKDAGNPDRVLSDKEEKHFQSQVDKVHEYMVDRIAESRKALSRDELAILADGRAYIGTEALKLKLIDELGGFDEARAYLMKKLQAEEDEVVFCAPSGGRFGNLLR